MMAARGGDPVARAEPLPFPFAEPSVMRMVLPEHFTPEMVRQMPDDGVRYETIHGELLVTPAPRRSHQRVVKRLLLALDAYCKATGVGEALASPADISLDADSLVQPDVFVHPPVADPDTPWEALPRPLLVAEVLSPGTARADRLVKRMHFQGAGVPVYWIVDAESRSVEVWTPDATRPQIERITLFWAPPGAPWPLHLAVDEIFR